MSYETRNLVHSPYRPLRIQVSVLMMVTNFVRYVCIPIYLIKLLGKSSELDDIFLQIKSIFRCIFLFIKGPRKEKNLEHY